MNDITNVPLGCGPEGSVSKHADLLNALEDMAGSYAYAVRKSELRRAGRVIAQQEREIESLLRDREKFVKVFRELISASDVVFGRCIDAVSVESVNRLKDAEKAARALLAQLENTH